MIKTKRELKEILDSERKLYVSSDLKTYIVKYYTNEISYQIWKFVKALRLSEYYSARSSKLSTLLYCFYRRRYNILGRKLNIEMYDNSFAPGLKIYHSNIVISSKAKIGKNCKLHGDNCIGNNGKIGGEPTLGDNIDIGVGAKIIGNITLANNITIGANAIVTKSFTEEDIVLIGIPARKAEK